MPGQNQDEDTETVSCIKGATVDERESSLASGLAPSRDFTARALRNDVALRGETDLGHAGVELGGAGGGGGAQGQVRVRCVSGVCVTPLTIPAAA